MKSNDQPTKILDFLQKNRGVDFCDDCLGTQTSVAITDACNGGSTAGTGATRWPYAALAQDALD
jgi:hypothetical protein